MHRRRTVKFTLLNSVFVITDFVGLIRKRDTIKVVVSKSTNQNVWLTFLAASTQCLMGVCWSYQTLFAIITKLITIH